MSAIKYLAAALLLIGTVRSDNSTAVEEESCPIQPEEGPWSALLEDWVTAERVIQGRHGRIMALPPTQGYYVSERIDLMPPPPPPPPHHHPHHMNHRGPYPMSGHHPGPHHGPPGPPDYHNLRPQNQPGQNSEYPNSRPQNPPSQNAEYSNSRPQIPPSQNAEYSNSRPQNPPGQNGEHLNSRPQNLLGQNAEYSNSRPHNQAGASQQGLPPGPPPPPQGAPSMPYDEWEATPPPPPGAGKIVNRPPNPYKDQFKPSYPPPSPNQPIPVHGSLSDRVDETRPPPHKQVSETDLYLLGAIEKLVYRVDLMEKRLRKMEENLHYLVAGAEAKPEPCQSNFTRAGSGCYHFSTDALNWKNANYACRRLKANLLEFDGDEKRQFVSSVLANRKLKGADFWTGGLNPGLLWIWSHSAKAVANDTASNTTTTVVGEGRCLALVHDPAVHDYVYRGQDCSLRHRYVCERDEDKEKLGNEIERVARKLREGKRKPKITWIEEDQP